MSRVLALVAMLGLSGCNTVLGLHELFDANPDVPDADQPDAAPDAPMCPTNYDPLFGLTSSYRKAVGKKTWKQAELDCEADSTLTHLAVPDTPPNDGLGELDSIFNYAGGFVWVGIARDPGTTTNNFRTITNVPVPRLSMLWRTGEPNDTNNTDLCARAENGVPGAKLNDTLCAAMELYVCECDGKMITSFTF